MASLAGSAIPSTALRLCQGIRITPRGSVAARLLSIPIRSCSFKAPSLSHWRQVIATGWLGSLGCLEAGRPRSGNAGAMATPCEVWSQHGLIGRQHGLFQPQPHGVSTAWRSSTAFLIRYQAPHPSGGARALRCSCRWPGGAFPSSLPGESVD
jgi:hypothetical protein